MSGPTLQLNITAPGQKSVQLSVETIERLARALETLPKASQELAKLQKQLAGVQAPAGLKTGAADFKQMVTEIQNLSAQLNTSFASLEETIKKGYTRTAQARAEGEKQSQRGGRSHVKSADDEIKDLKLAHQKLDAEYMAASERAKARRVLLARAMYDQGIDQAVVFRRVGPMAATQAAGMDFDQARSLASAASHSSRVAKESEAMRLKEAAEKAAVERWRTALQVNSAKMAESYRVGQEKLQAASDRWLLGVKLQSAKMAESLREGQAKEAASADAWRTRLQVNSAKMAESYRVGQEKLQAASDRWLLGVKLQSAKMAESLREGQAKEAASIESRRIRLQVVSSQWAESYRLSQEKLQAASEKWITSVKINSARMAEAAREAAAKEAASLLLAQQTKDAAYRQATAQRQASLTLQARAQLGEGVDPTTVSRRFGRLALERARSLVTSEELNEIKRGAQAKAGAIADSASKEASALLAAQQRLDAAYRVASERRRANQVLLARAMLDQGMDRAQVTRRVGTLAFDAAASTSFDTARQNVERLTGTAPRFKFFAASMNDAHSAARGLASGFGAMYLTWGRIAPLLAGAALSQSFVQSIKVGAGVKQELETIRVLSLESQDAVQGLERQLVALGERGPFGPQQVAEAMRILSLAGLSAQQVSVALKPSLDLAITGQTTIEKSAESLVAIGTAYGYQAEQFSGVADIIAKSAAVSMSSVDGMMQSFRQSSAVAQQYKVDLKDAATGLALLANVGIRNTAAGTSLRQMYAELSGASGPTRQAMQRLKVEVIDLEKGGMRPLLDIVKDLDKALGGLGPKAFVRAIQDMSNERGGKALVAVLEAIRAKAKEAGTTAQNELERIRMLIEDSAGFNAISAAELSATPLMQMKAVATGFQTAMAEAFKTVEPTIMVVSKRLQDLFKSEQFRDLVSSLASAMANLTGFVVRHLDLLKYIVAGYAAWKGAAVGIAAVTLAVNVGSAALALYRARGLQAAAAVTVMELASKRAAAASMAFLGPIGAIAGAIGLIALAYSATTAQVSASEVDAAQIRETVVAESLDGEIERLKKVNEELRKKPDLLLAEQRVAIEIDRQKRRMAVEAQVAPLEASLRQTEARIAEADKADPRLARGAELYVKNMPGAMEMATTGRSPRNPQEYKYVQSPEFKYYRDTLLRESLYQQIGDVYRPFQLAENKRAADREQVAQLSSLNQDLAARGARKYGDLEGWDSQNASFREQQAQSRALQGLQKTHSDRQQRIDRAFQRERELLEQSLRGKLIAEAEYANTSEDLAQREYAAKTANLAKFIAESEQLIKRMQGDPKTFGMAAPAVAQIAADKRQAQEDLRFAQAQERIRAASSTNLSDLKLDEDLAKLQRKGDLEVERLGIENQRLSMDPRLAAAEDAAAQRAAEFNDILAKQNDALKQVQARLDVYYRTQGEDAAGNPVAGFAEDPMVQRLNAQIKFLQGQIETAKAAQAVESGRAGAVAFARANENLKPQWQKATEGWQVGSKLLQETQDGFMNSWLERGQSMWMAFFEGGKINLKSFTKLMEQTLGEVIFKRFIAQPMMKLGDFAFDNFLRAPTTTAPGDTATAMKELGYTAQNLTDVFKNVGSGLYDLLVKAAQGIAAMLQNAGAGGGGGGLWSAIGNWLSGALTGGNTNTGAGDSFTNPYVAASAMGNAFGVSGLHAFARGGHFANSVVDTPTLFRFGMGGKDLGVMGERQPEAILPLERDSSGMLGVRASGSAGAAAPKVTVVIENHSGGPEPTVTESTAPNGDQMIKVMIGAATKDIGTGGPLRQSMQKHMNTGTRLRRY